MRSKFRLTLNAHSASIRNLSIVFWDDALAGAGKHHLSAEVTRLAESVVIDARRRFVLQGRALARRPLERIIFDPSRRACATLPMSVDELAGVIALVKGEFDALLEERRAAQFY